MRERLGNHMGLGSEDEMHVPVAEWPLWCKMAAAAMIGLAVMVLIGVVVALFLASAPSVSAGESVAPPRLAADPPRPDRNPLRAAPHGCKIGTEDEFLDIAGAYQVIESLALERLMTFLVWSGRPTDKVDRAWRGEANGHVVLIFVRGACVVGYVTMDAPTFTAVVEGRPLPKPPSSQMRKPARAHET